MIIKLNEIFVTDTDKLFVCKETNANTKKGVVILSLPYGKKDNYQYSDYLNTPVTDITKKVTPELNPEYFL